MKTVQSPSGNTLSETAAHNQKVLAAAVRELGLLLEALKSDIAEEAAQSIQEQEDSYTGAEWRLVTILFTKCLENFCEAVKNRAILEEIPRPSN